MIYIQTEDFDLSTEIKNLRCGRSHVGAVASFIGTVRDINEGNSVYQLRLEHYPGMTEKKLEEIEAKARARWSLDDVLIIHRIGDLNIEDQIVLVATTSEHREAALESCAYIMDFLKTLAPFWKKEAIPSGERWVDAREKDTKAQNKWEGV